MGSVSDRHSQGRRLFLVAQCGGDAHRDHHELRRVEPFPLAARRRQGGQVGYPGVGAGGAADVVWDRTVGVWGVVAGVWGTIYLVL